MFNRRLFLQAVAALPFLPNKEPIGLGEIHAIRGAAKNLPVPDASVTGISYDQLVNHVLDNEPFIHPQALEQYSHMKSWSQGFKRHVEYRRREEHRELARKLLQHRETITALARSLGINIREDGPDEPPF